MLAHAMSTMQDMVTPEGGEPVQEAGSLCLGPPPRSTQGTPTRIGCQGMAKNKNLIKIVFASSWDVTLGTEGPPMEVGPF
jgi:hypothetical protein